MSLFVDPITIDINRPEDNPTGGLVTVFKAKNLAGVGSKYKNRYYDGFYILVKVDKRHYARTKGSGKDHYTCVVRSTNSLLLKVPAWDYSLLCERDIIESLVQFSCCEQELVNAIDDAHDKIDPEKDEKMYVYLELKFPGCELKGEILNEEFDDDKQDLEPHKLDLARAKRLLKDDVLKKFNKDQRSLTDNYVVFKIARADSESEKRGKTDRTKKSKGAQLFEDDSPEKSMDV